MRKWLSERGVLRRSLALCLLECARDFNDRAYRKEVETRGSNYAVDSRTYLVVPSLAEIRLRNAWEKKNGKSGRVELLS